MTFWNQWKSETIQTPSMIPIEVHNAHVIRSFDYTLLVNRVRWCVSQRNDNRAGFVLGFFSLKTLKNIITFLSTINERERVHFY